MFAKKRRQDVALVSGMSLHAIFMLNIFYIFLYNMHRLHELFCLSQKG